MKEDFAVVSGGHGQISLQTPGGLGLYDMGTLQQQADNRSGFIPASYGAMYSGLTKNARGGYGVPVEENTLELRKAVLHTRCASGLVFVQKMPGEFN